MNTPGLIAKKIGMTRVVDANGKMVPVTLVQVQEQKVTKILTPERDGYHGIQVGFLAKAEKNLNKPDIGRMRKAGLQDTYARFREFRTEGALDGVELGTALSAKGLEGVKVVDVTGFTKGRGFTGALVRWNSARGRMTHGSQYHRRTGSIGMRTTPGRTFKNKHMPGHWGDEQRTIQNLSIVDFDEQNNVLALKGSIPGHAETYVVIRPAIKSTKSSK